MKFQIDVKILGDEKKSALSVMSAYSQQESQLFCACSVGVCVFPGGLGGVVLMNIAEKESIAQW